MEDNLKAYNLMANTLVLTNKAVKHYANAKIDRDSYESELVYIPIFSSFLVSFFA